MVNSGLLVREAAPDDRRSVVLVLTPSGERALQALSAAHIRELRESAPVLDSLLELLKPGRAENRAKNRTKSRIKRRRRQ